MWNVEAAVELSILDTYKIPINSLFIIEYNFIMCNKGLWDKISIEDGDKIEVITLVGGG